MSEQDNKNQEGPIGWVVLGGLVYSILIARSVHVKAWSSATMLFCFGIVLLAVNTARIARRR